MSGCRRRRRPPAHPAAGTAVDAGRVDEDVAGPIGGQPFADGCQGVDMGIRGEFGIPPPGRSSPSCDRGPPVASRAYAREAN